MIKKTLLLIGMSILAAGMLFGQMEQMVNNFDAAPADTNFWRWFDQVNSSHDWGAHYQLSDNADTDLGWINVDYIADPVQEGPGAMELEYSAQNIEGWGGYSKIEHWAPDGEFYDFSAYDSIAFWYYNAIPQSEPGTTHLRFNLHDGSDSDDPSGTDVGGVEYYYSFHYILDNEPGWNRVALILEGSGDYWSGEGFNLTGWSGITGNTTLDKDKIRGYSLEFSIGGGGEGNFSGGTIIIDHLALVSPSAVEVIWFNGMAVPNNVALNQPWSGNVVVTDEDAFTPGTNSLLWNAGAQWAGPTFTLNTPANYFVSWATDSIRFKMKAPAALGQLRLHFADDVIGDGDFPFEAHYPLEAPAGGYDNTWQEYAIALADFNMLGGYWNVDHLENGHMDSSRVSTFGILASGGDYSGLQVYFDEIWTGTPEVDVIPPDPPTGVAPIAADYYNLVIWQDVPGEEGEVYNVYASQQPIVDLEDPSVDLIELAVLEGLQTAVHWLTYPLVDEDLEYYYAVVCTDMAGNISDAGFSGSIVNTAQGIPTISLDLTGFVADGDFGEWDAAGIEPFEIRPSTHTVPPPGVVDSDDDLTGYVWLAADDENLYVASYVLDDVYHLGEGNWWDNDAFQMFIGLYDWRGPKHAVLQRGDEPDYIFYFNENQAQLDNPTNTTLFTPDDEDYFFMGINPDYVIECAIPLDTVAVRSGDPRFYPGNGMRIPIELYFHDNDGVAWDGNLGMSPYNADNAHTTPRVWVHTWIGDQDGFCDNNGDVNHDTALDILDVVLIIGHILGTDPLDDDQTCSADVNGDGNVDILDVVMIVDMILNPAARASGASSATIYQDNGVVSIDGNGYVAGVQMTLKHGADFALELNDHAFIADYATRGNLTTLVIVNPEEAELFTAQGDFKITEVIAASGSGYVDVNIADQYALLSNYPNPFNPSTSVNYYIPTDGQVNIAVFNLMGQKVATLANTTMARGSYNVQWNGTTDSGTAVSSGIYFVRLDHAGTTVNHKVTLMK